MHVLMDGICIQSHLKGVGRYALNTAQQLLKMEPSLRISILFIDTKLYECLLKDDRVKSYEVRWQNHLWHGFKTLPLWTRRLHPDVVYIPYETPVGRMRQPYAMVCHDVPQKIREAQLKGDGHPRKIGSRISASIDDILLRRALRGASVVFGNTRYVSGWLGDEVCVDPTRILHAPCAPGADFHSLSRTIDVRGAKQKLMVPNDYILVIYTGDPRENFSSVQRVYQRIVDEGLPHHLLIAGVKESVRSLVESTLARYSWRDRVRVVPFLESGREKELAEIYAAASVYLDPSLQEGFGMQVIEAMACGTPVVCSNRGALPEVAGNAALLVNPEDPAEMAQAVKRVLSEERLRRELQSLGYERSSSFSWESTAKVIYQGLSEAAARSNS